MNSLSTLRLLPDSALDLLTCPSRTISPDRGCVSVTQPLCVATVSCSIASCFHRERSSVVHAHVDVVGPCRNRCPKPSIHSCHCVLQGEEALLVIISLTRNNKAGDIGFLKMQVLQIECRMYE